MFTFPQKDAENKIYVDGMYVLQALPSSRPLPQPFAENSLYVLQNVINKIENKFAVHSPQTVLAWKQWASEEAPTTNDVVVHTQQHPLHIPLGDILFSGASVDNSVVTPIDRFSHLDIPRVRTTDSLTWGRRGVVRPADDPENLARVEVIGYDALQQPIYANALVEKVLFAY